MHDVEELRAFRYNDYYKHEFEIMLELADVIIVHNEVMKQWFMDLGVSERKLISLRIFDYLQKEETEKDIIFEKSITIAGNLDTTKCGYIGKLGELSDIKIHLYGPNFSENLRAAENIEYHGSFPVDDIPRQLNKGFGLVWDGDSIDGCKGQSGQYLRFNNPHKLSLYLSSGMPVVIWKEAAEAKFVEENRVGIIVNDLQELTRILNTFDEKTYKELSLSVGQLMKGLRNGFYARNAISKAISFLEG